jgi:hypothetical protein
MEQLARDFNDPEVDTFIDQAIFYAVGRGAMPLKELSETVARSVPSDLRNQRSLSGIQLQNRVMARFIRGSYRGRLGPQTLARDGLVDLLWDVLPASEDELAVLLALVDYNGQTTQRLRNELDWPGERLANAMHKLENGGWLVVSNNYVRLDPQHLRVRAVGADTPIVRTPQGRFVLTAHHQLSPAGNPIMYGVSAEERSRPDHPDFSRAARRMLSTDKPLILTGRAYKGALPAKDRRALEHQFVRFARPNFLSSGPAMEVGVDIGELDRVMLYGTPPNINAYLQRIGRAGRRTKQALIFSVSKRNPIDLYYYQEPLRLIESAAQPVPLFEHNERVVEAALTAAVLDFVAGSFAVPWKSEGAGAQRQVTCTSEPTRLPSSADFMTWTQVQNSPTYSVDDACLVTLEDLVQRQEHEVRAYLVALLGYSICNRCGRSGDLGASACVLPNCAGRMEPASEKFAALVDEAIGEFGPRMLWASRSTLAEFRARKRELKQRSLDLDEQIDVAPPAEKAALRQQVRQVDNELGLVLQLEEATTGASLRINHEESAMARFGSGIRGINSEVTVELISSSSQNEQHITRTTRDIGPALREFAPGAISLHNTEEFVTLAVSEDVRQTLELQRRLADLGFVTNRACRSCCRFVDGADCDICGRPIVEIEIMVPGRARAFRRDEPMGGDPRDSTRRLFPSHAFPLGGSENVLESTYVPVASAVLSFAPRRILRAGSSGREVQLALGDIELLFTAETITASYESGEREVFERAFHLCPQPGCGGVITPAVNGVAGFCMLDSTHDVSQSRIVKMAWRFSTVGVKLSADSMYPFGHSLLHGVRAGLEKVAGVLVRDVGEHVVEDAGYIFDAEPGGSGVSELLVDPANDYLNLRTVLDVTQTLATCKCEDGCPHCLFQYGCADRNAPEKLSRRSLVGISSQAPIQMEAIVGEVIGV